MSKVTVAMNAPQMQPYLEYGRVREGEGTPMVKTASGVYHAVTAASCVLRPGTGDLVLVSLDDNGTCYILSVLTRGPSQEGENNLFFRGNVRLHTEGGSLSLSSSEEVSLASPRVSAAGTIGEAVFEDLSLVGSSLSARFGTIRTIAGNVEQIFHRLTERLIDAFRFVKDHEEVQSGSTRYLVETNLTMHSKNAMHVAEELVSINAEQINLC